jgi:hypothetical protein
MTRYKFGLIIGFTEPLYLVITKDYKAVTNPHILQITIAHVKYSQYAVPSRARCLLAASNNGDPSASMLMSFLSSNY